MIFVIISIILSRCLQIPMLLKMAQCLPPFVFTKVFLLYFLSITNKMQRYTIFFITVNAVHASGGFSARHQGLKDCTHSIWYMPSLLAATVSVGELELTHPSGSSRQA